MTKKRRRVYAPRVFDGRIIMSDEIGRIKEFLELECIGVVSDSMRELIEDLWPELVHKLSLKEVAGMTKCRPRPRTRPRS